MSEQSAYTVPQAAREFGFTDDVIYAAIKSGDIPAWQPTINGKTSRTWRLLHADIVDWIRHGKAAS